MYCLTRFLWNACYIRYVEEERSHEDPADWSDASRHMLFGLLSKKRHGTCASLPVLLVAVARRMGYPMFLVHSSGHVFCRWDAEQHKNPAWRERRNIDFSGDFNSNPDEYYCKYPVAWTPLTLQMERQRPIPLYLRSLTPADELASFLVQRAFALEAHGQFIGAVAAYKDAHRLASYNDEHVYFSRKCHHDYLDHVLEPWCMTAFRYCNLLKRRFAGEQVEFPRESKAGDHRPPLDDPQARHAIELAIESVQEAVWLPNRNRDTQSSIAEIADRTHRSDSSHAEHVDSIFTGDLSSLFT